MSQFVEVLKQARNALDISISLNERSSHFPTIRDAYNALDKLIEQIEKAEPDGEHEWERLAFALCEEEHGDDACNDLIWDGGYPPEPWGERWMKYEGEAKRMIKLVREHVANPASSEDLPPQIPAHFICNGCDCLTAEHWTEYPDGERDSGTYAHCRRAGRDIPSSPYWTENDSVPIWCPKLPAAPKEQQASQTLREVIDNKDGQIARLHHERASLRSRADQDWADAEELRNVILYAIDNPEFDSCVFDSMCRAAARATQKESEKEKQNG